MLQNEIEAKIRAGSQFVRGGVVGGTLSPPELDIPAQQPAETRIAELCQHVSEAGYALTEARRAFQEAQMRLNICEQNFAQASDALLEQINHHRGTPTPVVNRPY